MEYEGRVYCSDRMSNSGYHRGGKPTWWARVDSTFAKFQMVRGDSKLDQAATIELPGDGIYTLNCGAGKGKDGVRDEDKIVAYTTVDGEHLFDFCNDSHKEITKLVASGMSYAAAHAYSVAKE